MAPCVLKGCFALQIYNVNGITILPEATRFREFCGICGYKKLNQDFAAISMWEGVYKFSCTFCWWYAYWEMFSWVDSIFTGSCLFILVICSNLMLVDYIIFSPNSLAVHQLVKLPVVNQFWDLWCLHCVLVTFRSIRRMFGEHLRKVVLTWHHQASLLSFQL